MAPIVVKLGGRALEAEGALATLAAELRPWAGRVVLVHGGGPEVTAWSTRLGLEARFHEGRRVTDAETLEVATAVLAGLANKRLVAGLAAHGVDAVGLSALDGGIVRAVPHPDAAMGAVGTIAAVDASLVRTLLADGRTPVLASIGAHAGALLNLNADDVAAALASGLKAGALVLLSDAKGLMLDGRLVARLDADAADAARAHADVKDGMAPKLEAAVTAVRGGVKRAVIAAWNGPGTLVALVEGAGDAGTHVTAEPLAQETEHGR